MVKKTSEHTSDDGVTRSGRSHGSWGKWLAKVAAIVTIVGGSASAVWKFVDFSVKEKNAKISSLSGEIQELKDDVKRGAEEDVIKDAKITSLETVNENLQLELDDCPGPGTGSPLTDPSGNDKGTQHRVDQKYAAQLAKDNDGLKRNLEEVDAENRRLVKELQTCRSGSMRVTTRNFWLRLNRRNVVSYRGAEYGFRFAKWLSRDTTDVMIAMDTPGASVTLVELEESRGEVFRYAGLRFRMKMLNPQRINDRVQIEVDEVE